MPKDTTAVLDKKPAAATAPCLLVGAFGRGSVGKSVTLAELAWAAMASGRNPIVADFDPKSRTLAGMFPDAIVPSTEETADMKAAISGLLNRMISERRSAVVDFGTGERVLVEYGKDMNLVRFCERRGITPVAILAMGPEDEDFRHVEAIWKSGAFRPERVILLLNEGVVKGDQTVATAFERTINQPGFIAMVEAGAKVMLVRRLAAMDAIRRSGVGFYAAAAGRAAIDPVSEFMAEEWLDDLQGQRAALGITEWVP
ncbi:MAG: uncharacterized protein JWP57_4379 [Spirosoma sp.]|nr:uncharacterized protein [Spirosoma sp.]